MREKYSWPGFEYNAPYFAPTGLCPGLPIAMRGVSTVTDGCHSSTWPLECPVSSRHGAPAAIAAPGETTLLGDPGICRPRVWKHAQISVVPAMGALKTFYI